MSTPDMSDEPAVVRARARFINADADQTIQIIGDEPPRALADRVVAAVQARMEHDDATYEVIYASNLVHSAFEAMSESGYALVCLPEPTEPEHQRPWRLMPEALWRVGRCEVTASFDGIDPKVGVGWDFGGGLGFKGDQVRRVAAAMLAAADHAERLADEHNTAAQDREAGATDGN